jgi:hypothetical protein
MFLFRPSRPKMEGKFCAALQDICKPKDCNREFCPWQDTVWAIQQMSKWAYSEEVKPDSQLNANPQKPPKNQ